MKSRYELDENDIKTAIAEHVYGKGVPASLHIGNIELVVHAIYGKGMDDGTIVGHSVSAVVEGDKARELKR